MYLSPEQIKGRIKNIAAQNHTDARVLLRFFMMERFLERLALSVYKDNFIIKGGMLVTAMIGVALRSTMDIDTSIKNHKLTAAEALKIVQEINNVQLDDGIAFAITGACDIMDDMEYQGVRINLQAVMEKLAIPLKIDISTGDVITPGAVEFSYKCLLEERNIKLWSYNLETILAEKLQTILARGVVNTRMRDFYDVHILWQIYANEVGTDVLCSAFIATCEKRNTDKLLVSWLEIVSAIGKDGYMQKLWESYQLKYPYARGISFTDCLRTVGDILQKFAEKEAK